MNSPVPQSGSPSADETFELARAAAVNAAREIRNSDNEFLYLYPELVREGFQFYVPSMEVEDPSVEDPAVKALTHFYLKVLRKRDPASRG